MRQVILGVIRDAAAARKKAEAARVYARERFAPRRMAEETVAVYRQVALGVPGVSLRTPVKS